MGKELTLQDLKNLQYIHCEMLSQINDIETVICQNNSVTLKLIKKSVLGIVKEFNELYQQAEMIYKIKQPNLLKE